MKKEEKKKNKNEDIEVTLKFNKKKIIQGVGIALIVLAVLGIAFAVSSNTSKSTKTFEFVDITIDEYLEKMNSSEKSIIYVARPTCSWCQKESPIIKSLGAQYDLTIYYLNTDNVTSDDEAYEKFQNSSEHYQGEWGTPNTIIVSDGKIVDGEFGYVEKATLKRLFERNGFIDE